MADILKEIYSGTLTMADVASTGAATLVTTDATTQYAVKDVAVIGTFLSGSTPSLLVNTFPVADLSAGSVTGSEIVDINSSLKFSAFSTAPSLTTQSFKFMESPSGSGAPFVYNDYYTYNINGVIQSTVVNSNTAVSTGFTGSTQAYNFAKSNDGSIFYVNWDGNSSCSFYKRTGGVNGSETNLFNLSYGWMVFNNVDTYYYAANNYGTTTLNKYNINTGVTTTSSAFPTLATTSYPSATLMNDGNILVNYSGNSQVSELTIINPINNTYTVVSGLTGLSVAGTSYKIFGFYNSTTNRYTLYRRYNTTLYKSVLNSALTIGSAYSGGTTETTLTLPSGFGAASGNYNTTYTTADSTNYSVARHGVASKTDLLTFNTLTSTTTTVPFLSYGTYTDSFVGAPVSASAPASAFTNTVKVRVTGVKATN